MHIATNTFKALADATRLQILGLILLRGEICVCDVEAILEITQSKSSRHMRYLSNAGLVAHRREGVWLHYRLAPELDAAHRDLLEGLPALLGDAEMRDLGGRLDRWLAAKATRGPCATRSACADAAGRE